MHIGQTHEFGVFPELCTNYSPDNASSIGTREFCEAERDRINAKRTTVPAENGIKTQQEAMASL